MTEREEDDDGGGDTAMTAIVPPRMQQSSARVVPQSRSRAVRVRSRRKSHEKARRSDDAAHPLTER